MTAPPLEAIVIGASAGAVEALSFILPTLPSHFPLPILVVVHLPPDKGSVMVNLFHAKCRMKVKEAEDKEPIQGGTIYFAPPDYHLLVERDRRLSLSSEEPALFSRPSIDVLFETAADTYGSGLVGIILTGANNDGANGLKAIVESNGIALIQHPELAYASFMPRASIEACPDAHVMTLKEIAEYLQGINS